MLSLADATPVADPSLLQLWLVELLVLLEVHQSYATYGTTSPSDQGFPSSAVAVAADCHLDHHHILPDLVVFAASAQPLVVALVEVQAHSSELPSPSPWPEVDLLAVVQPSHEVVGPLVVDLALHVVLELLVVWPCGSSTPACSVVETKLQGEAFCQAEPFHAQKELPGQPPPLLCLLLSSQSSAQP